MKEHHSMTIVIDRIDIEDAKLIRDAVAGVLPKCAVPDDKVKISLYPV